MNLMLDSFKTSKGGVLGRLFTDAGELVAVTLEHAYESGIEGHSAKVPAGTYRCVRGMHDLDGEGPKVPFETFEIMGVAGHWGLLFHKGNFNRDSKGCVLVGEAFADIDQDGYQDVTNSGATFTKFMALQDGVDEFELRVVRG